MRKTEKILLSAGVFLAGASIFCGCVFAQQFKKLENPRFKYAVKYPASYLVKALDGIIVLISGIPDKNTEFVETVNIAAETLAEPVPKLDEFFILAKRNLSLRINGYKVLEEKKDKLSGANAYRLIYTSKQKNNIFKLMQVVSIYKGRAYVVTYTALAEQYDRGLAQANAIIKSLKFTD